MPRVHKRPSALRDSWRPVGKTSGVTRRFRRLFVTLLTMLLIFAFFYLLLTPFLHPTSHIVLVAAKQYRLQGVPIVESTNLAPIAFASPAMALPGASPSVDTQVQTLATPETLDDLFDSLDSRSIRAGDVLMIHIRAHGVALDGQPFLLCENFDASVSQGGRYSIEKLLAKLKQTRAKYKLLFLDTGSLNDDPRLGIVANEFPVQLQRAVERTNDAGLWVLHSHSELERSHTSRNLGGSVFGHFVSGGLNGAADLNEDRFIDLEELFRFVRGNVSAWVNERAEGSATQTPMLLFGGGPNPLRNKLTLLPVPQASPTIEADSFRGAKGHVNAQPVPAVSAAESAAEPEPDSEATESDAPEPAPAALPDDQPAFETEEAALAYEAWQLQDKIVGRHTSTPNPIDYAPHLWREFSRRLLVASTRVWNELQLVYRPAEGAGVKAAPDPNDVKELQQLVAGMRSLVAGQQIRPTAIDLIQKIGAMRPRSKIAIDEARTLGLLEVAAGINSQSLPRLLREDVTAFDASLAAADRQGFDEWIEKAWKESYDKLFEWRTARRLAEHQEFGWDVVQVAVRACRSGERIAAHETSMIPWIRETIESADRDRTTALRKLFDGIGYNSESVALRHLLNAITQYERASGQISRYQELVALGNDSLMLAPEYLRLSCLGPAPPEVPDHRQLVRFIDALSEFTIAFQELEEVSPPELERLAERLSSHREALESSFRRAAAVASNMDDPRWLNAYLNTQLPTAEERVILLSAAPPQLAAWNDKSHVRPASAFVSRSLTRRDWIPPAERVSFELRLARLASLAAPPSSGVAAQEVFDVQFASLFSNARSTETPLGWTEFRQAGDALKQLYRSMPSSIESIFQQNRDLSEREQRSVRRSRLRDAERGLRLLDPRDNRLLDAQPLVEALRDAATYDLLAWHIERWQVARQDAPEEEARYLTNIASRYRLLAMALPGQPSLPAEMPPLVSVAGPSAASLVSEPQRQITASVTSRAASAQPVWLIVDYDAELLEVIIEDLASAYDQNELVTLLPRLAVERREAVEMEASKLPADQASLLLTTDSAVLSAAELASMYPFRPDAFDLPPTTTVRAGETVNVQVTLRATGASSRPAKVVLKAVSGDAYVRHAVDVPLPGDQALVLSARGNPEAWSSVDGRIELHPLAGHRTGYGLQLANRGPASMIVDVELLALQQELLDAIPDMPFAPDDLGRIMEKIQPLSSLNSIEELVLPATGVPIPLRFRPPSDEPVAAPQGNGDASSDVNTVNAAEPTPAEAAVPLTSVRHGLVLLVTDRNSHESILRRIDFKPRRPRSYLQAVASYDLGRERLSIRVTPLDPNQVPSNGFQVRCEFAEPLPRGAEARLNGIVNAPQFEAVLYADVPASTNRIVTAVVHVDGYPRGFTFHVPCSKSDDSIHESTGTLAVSVFEPLVGQAFAAPVARIPIKLRVDAPVGAFERAGDVVEVGVDMDRDREFRDEATLKLFSDRQVDVNLLPLDATGDLQFDTRVTDFQIEVPGGSLQNARVNLLARLQVAGKVAWSEPVEVILDQSGPTIDRVQVFPDRIAIVDSELEVRVWGGDGDLSGLDKVLVGFDVDRSGKFSEAVPPIPAERGEGAVWIAKIPASGIAPGPVTLLVQATDRVGNPSGMTKVKLEIVTEEEAMARRKAAVNRVVGTASYGNSPVPNTEVSLEGDEPVDPVKTDEQGRFVFPAVPPGKYKLNASGVARNKPRFADIEEIEVRPAPSQPTRLRIELK